MSRWNFQVVSNFRCIFIIGTVSVLIAGSSCSNVSPDEVYMSEEALQELKLTRPEKVAFEQFKAAVWNDIKYDIIKHDLFLLRWIRAHGFRVLAIVEKSLNVNQAVSDMKTFLQLIKEQKIETIADEDWSDMEEEYPFYTNLTDRRGQPVAHANVGNSYTWNVRRGILEGKRQRLMRYMYKIVFGIYKQLVQIGKHQPNVTQFVVLLNMDNFNPYEHMCPLCISTYANLVVSYEKFFPGYTREIIVINAPQAYLVLVDTLTPLVSKASRDLLKIFGTDKTKWKPYLEARMDTRSLEYIGVE